MLDNVDVTKPDPAVCGRKPPSNGPFLSALSRFGMKVKVDKNKWESL